MAMLEVQELRAWYGASQVVRNVDLAVAPGEILTLVGRNGAGKTSTIRAIMGLMPRAAGRIAFEGVDLQGRPAHERFRRRLAYVPEDRRIVPGLSVLENLQLGLVGVAGKHDAARRVEEVATTFPRLKERLRQEAVTLSGGEQQMLAIARALMARPAMIMLDEPSEGIMPVLVEEMSVLFRRLRDEGMALLLVEQNVEWALRLADRAVVLDQGAIVYESTAAAMLADADVQERYCAV